MHGRKSTTNSGGTQQASLNDDDFFGLTGRCILSIRGKPGRDYIHFLLEEQFAPQWCIKKVESDVPVGIPRRAVGIETLTSSDNESNANEAMKSLIHRLRHNSSQRRSATS